MSLKHVGDQPTTPNDPGKLECNSSCSNCSSPFLEWKCFSDIIYSATINDVCNDVTQQCSIEKHCGDITFKTCPRCFSQDGSDHKNITSTLMYTVSQQELKISCTDGLDEQEVCIGTKCKFVAYLSGQQFRIGDNTRACVCVEWLCVCYTSFRISAAIKQNGNEKHFYSA